MSNTIRFGIIATFSSFIFAPIASAAGISSSVSLETLSPDQTQFFSLGVLPTGQVAMGITAPIADLPIIFGFPDTEMATFFTSDVGPGDISALTLTYNDDSFADSNTVFDDTLGSLYRLEAPATDNYSVGITGFDDGFEGTGHPEEGNYFFTRGVVDPSTLGGDFADTDGTNETIAGADPLPLANFESKIAVNTLAPMPDGDNDFYEITLNAGDVLTAMTAPLDDLGLGTFDFPDTVLFLFDDQGNFILDDDEAGDVESDFTGFLGPHDGLGSAFHFLAPTSGTYYLAVSGYPSGDNNDIVPHPEFGDYALLVSRTAAIPEPASLLLLCFGICSLGMRRNR